MCSSDLVAVTEGYPAPDSKQPLTSWSRLPGGQVATAAAVAARLGCRTRYVGVFGDDDAGRLGIQSLADERVDTACCVVMQATDSRQALLLVDGRTGQRTVLWRRPDALDLVPGSVPDEVWRSGRMLLVDGTDMPASLEAEIGRAHV